MSTIKGSGNRMTETREVRGFDGVDLAGVGKLIVRQTGSESLVIEGDDNIVPLVKTEVSESRLIIKLEPNTSVNPKVPLVYNVTVKDIRSLGLSGAGSVEASDINSSYLETYLSGVGSVALHNIAANEIGVSLSGAGDISVSGNADTQHANLSGAGRYDAAHLKSYMVTVVASGAGGAIVWATGTLNATMTGVGGIQYYGNPQIQINRGGLGSIRALGEK